MQIQESFFDFIATLQETITREIQKLDPQIEIITDKWKRKDFEGKDGGGGITRAFQNGSVFENAGVNISKIYGEVDPSFATKIGGTSSELFATGISMILHPINPKVPTMHANYRFIIAGERFWFGGGQDLTPFYPYVEDFAFFHEVLRSHCSDLSQYQKFKKDCDFYFSNHHRVNENGQEVMRGIGGIFFDHYFSGNLKEDLKMVMNLAQGIIPSYFPIVEKRKDEKFNEEDVEFQLYRRGRYVEFNLLHDRGTAFGLQSNGRTESILISLPKRAQFGYNYRPLKNSKHEEMMAYYYPHPWVSQ